MRFRESEHVVPGSGPDRGVGRRKGRRRWVALWVSLPLAVVLLSSLHGTATRLPAGYGPLSSFPADTSRKVQRVAPGIGQFSLYQLPDHPSIIHSPYIPMVSPDQRVLVQDPRYASFYELLHDYVIRQAVDDNFTIRVTDARNGSLLELYELETDRARYRETGVADWGQIDTRRRRITTDLIDKYEKLGIPQGNVRVRWGRLDQVQEARKRDIPYLAYEIRLARWLGLSLLATEIGTVETFNRDDMVSSAGARGRYQFMPTMLRKFGLRQYRLQTTNGKQVDVREEQHPMLALIPAFTLVRAYSNAVGHEVLGISAFHTGPYNIFKLMDTYLAMVPRSARGYKVMDAYVWALTDGFERISSASSFRTHSRGYIPSIYGSLRAMEHEPIDFADTFIGEQVPLKNGVRFTLSDLISAIDGLDPAPDWAHAENSPSTFSRFSSMNPHMRLDRIEPSSRVSDRSNLVFQTADSGPTLRIFLPLDVADRLAAAGNDWFDRSGRLRFDHHLFSSAVTSEQTALDVAYQELVNDIGRFGYTLENRDLLQQLVPKFEQAARFQPTLYRRMQADIIGIHEQVWTSRFLDNLAAEVNRAFGPNPEARYADLDPELRPNRDRVAK